MLETGDAHQQATEPATLDVGLTDSPAGGAGWIAEKVVGRPGGQSRPGDGSSDTPGHCSTAGRPNVSVWVVTGPPRLLRYRGVGQSALTTDATRVGRTASRWSLTLVVPWRALGGEPVVLGTNMCEARYREYCSTEQTILRGVGNLEQGTLMPPPSVPRCLILQP